MRTRAKRKHVAEIKLQEVDDMYQILMPGRTMVGENAISMAKEQISGLGSHALIISGKIVEKSGIVNFFIRINPHVMMSRFPTEIFS